MHSIELFSGAGGLALGLSEAGFQHKLLVDWDEPSHRTMMHNKEQGLAPLAHWPIKCADVRPFDFSPYADRIDLVAGGPPCQPFSIGGKHKGASDQRDMWPHAIRAVRETRPRAFVFENVRGLLRPAFTGYLHYIDLQLRWPEIVRKDNEDAAQHLARLEKHERSSPNKKGLNYRVEVHPVDAANYGTPQNRRRVVLVGLRSDVDTPFHFPPETHSRMALLWDQSTDGSYWERHKVPNKQRPKLDKLRAMGRPTGAAWVTVRDAIGDLPEPGANHVPIPNHRFQAGARAYVGHTGSPLDLPAKALKAGDHGVPGGENMLRRHDGSVRYFTVREAARLQGFPESYVFPDAVAWSEAMRQLGNAVPLHLAKAVGKELASTLGYRSVVKTPPARAA
jgi:DNA (cytosine-5)-methyltransferase 1